MNRMTWGIGALLAGVSLGAAAVAPFHRRAPLQERLVPAYGGKGRLYSDGDYPSPDGRYIARTLTGEAAVVTLTVIDARTHRHLAQVYDADGFIWAPRRGHRLVVAASAIYGTALQGLWEDGRGWRSLHPVRRPDNEAFTLYGVTRDGQCLVYGHEPDLDHAAKSLGHRQWLRLP